MNNNRLLWIDFLKGFAILGVILVHFNGVINAPSHTFNSIAAIGARCPQLFFIISAYLCWYSISKNETLNTKMFLKKRFIKIAPLYYLSLILIGLIPTIRYFGWGDIVTHLTFINGFFPTYTNSIMKVEWYIADLAIFYMIVPILYRYIKNLKSAAIAFALSTIINIVFTITTNCLLKEQIASSGVYEMYFHTFCFINQLPVLLVGILLYYSINKLKRQPEIRKKYYFVCTIISLTIIILFLSLHLNKTVMTSSYIAGLGFGCAILLFFDFKTISGGIISFLGTKSYGMYCIHMLFINMMKECNCLSDLSNNIVGWLILYISVVVFSFLIGSTLESTINLYIKKR